MAKWKNESILSIIGQRTTRIADVFLAFKRKRNATDESKVLRWSLWPWKRLGSFAGEHETKVIQMAGNNSRSSLTVYIVLIMVSGGTADAKIAVLVDDLRVYWTLGRSCEWQRPWDEVRFK